MKIPDMFTRVQDGKVFRITYVGFTDKRKQRIQSIDRTEIDDIIWVNDNFYVSGDTGHTYRTS